MSEEVPRGLSEASEGEELRAALATTMGHGVGEQLRMEIESVERIEASAHESHDSVRVIEGHNPACAGEGEIESFRLTVLRTGDDWSDPSAEGVYWNGAEYEYTQAREIVSILRVTP